MADGSSCSCSCSAPLAAPVAAVFKNACGAALPLTTHSRARRHPVAFQTFAERESLNVAIVRNINEAAEAWGLECMR